MFCEIGKGLRNDETFMCRSSAITNFVVNLYRILQFELMLSVSGFVVALGALLTGVFGKKCLGTTHDCFSGYH